jgi:hypothetical protein
MSPPGTRSDGLCQFPSRSARALHADRDAVRGVYRQPGKGLTACPSRCGVVSLPFNAAPGSSPAFLPCDPSPGPRPGSISPAGRLWWAPTDDPSDLRPGGDSAQLVYRLREHRGAPDPEDQSARAGRRQRPAILAWSSAVAEQWFHVKRRVPSGLKPHARRLGQEAAPSNNHDRRPSLTWNTCRGLPGVEGPCLSVTLRPKIGE